MNYKTIQKRQTRQIKRMIRKNQAEIILFFCIGLIIGIVFFSLNKGL